MEPAIVTRPPGPLARAVLERDAKVISQSMVREYPLVLERAKGTNLWDVDGNRYLDFTAGIAVMNMGWNHPRIVRAIRRQARLLSHHAFLDFCSDLPVRFAEELLHTLPKGLDRVFLSNSGAESVEAALKLARHHTGRNYFIAFLGAFHGRTYGALSLTAGRVVQRARFGPFLPVIHIPYANPYRPPGGCASSCDLDVLRYLREEIFRREVDPSEVAAIVVEPVQGEGGYVVPPPGFLRGLREICDEHGILLIADEVQSGCMRTGRFLACEHFGVVPDIVCLAKAIGGGLPMGVTVSSEEVNTWPQGSHANTFGGNSLACAAALEVLDMLRAPDLGEQVRRRGEQLLRGLRRLQKKHELVGDTRGLGLMCGMELVRSRETKEPARKERTAVLNRAFESGYTFLPAGLSTIRFCPPLVIGRREIQLGLSALDEALETVGGSAGVP